MDYSALSDLDFDLGIGVGEQLLPAEASSFDLPSPLSFLPGTSEGNPNADFALDLDLPDTLQPSDDTAQTLPAFPTPKQINAWDPRLILDLAIAVDDLETILTRYQLTRPAYDRLTTTQAFRRELALTIREIRENGASFRQKAKIQAESYLEVLDDMVYSETTPASVRLDAIKSTVAWGDLVPKEAKGEAVNAQQINVNISF